GSGRHDSSATIGMDASHAATSAQITSCATRSAWVTGLPSALISGATAEQVRIARPARCARRETCCNAGTVVIRWTRRHILPYVCDGRPDDVLAYTCVLILMPACADRQDTIHRKIHRESHGKRPALPDGCLTSTRGTRQAQHSSSSVWMACGS